MKAFLRYALPLCMLVLITIALQMPAVVPPGPMQPYLNGAFPATAPSEGASWSLEDPLPGMTFQSPVRMQEWPNGKDLLVLSKLGEVWRIDMERQQKYKVLDIKDRSFKLGEAGTVGMALHPHFGNPAYPEQQHLYVYYRYKPDPDSWSELGYNRLSRFTWNSDQGSFDAASEKILIQQYDRSTWHNGGALFFGPDGFLYFSVGDEGRDRFQAVSTQRLDGGLFSGIFRIDVDNDSSRSHPIRRQPQALANPEPGWPETFSRGYSIPNDNPWQSPDSSYLEEYYALGLRSPFSMYYAAETGKIWVADVGSSIREEVNRVSAGDNLEWPYREGKVDRENPRPEQLIGREQSTYFEYGRETGFCIIGGGVYQGGKFPELNETYLYGDFLTGDINALERTGSQSAPVPRRLLNIASQPVELPEGATLTGLTVLRSGEVLVSVMGDHFEHSGKIYRLQREAAVEEPPVRLSELGVFTDMQTLQVADGVIPYRVNAALWSDRALKRRWMALPNDGTFDQASEQIQYRRSGPWQFPEGTVFIKHFELPTSIETNTTTRLETRFFVIGKAGRGYGLTYKWNPEGTEAFLMGGGSSRTFDITAGDQIAFRQTWDYPSREQCMNCHTAAAKHVLGLKTAQLNGEASYPRSGRRMNQLNYLRELGALRGFNGLRRETPQTAALNDNAADLQWRVRSYLDANCAGCHRPGGVNTSSLDLRFSTPLALTNMVGSPTQSLGSHPGRDLVHPGLHQQSELWVRDASMDTDRMPPLGRNLPHEQWLELLADWIDGLSDDTGTITETLIYPNPAVDHLNLRIRDDWTGPFDVTVLTAEGRVVRQRQFSSRSAELDLNALTAGVCILRISAGTDAPALHRIVVQ